jgi:hypothetical protein
MCSAGSDYMPLLTERENSDPVAINMLLLRSKNQQVARPEQELGYKEKLHLNPSCRHKLACIENDLRHFHAM